MRMDREDIKEVIGRFPQERTYLLPVLHAVQEEVRYLPGWALAEISIHLKVPKSEVYGVASSYPEFRLEEPGEHILRVCTGLQCYLSGAASVMDSARKALGIYSNKTNTNGTFSFEETPCLFICPMAPAVELDGLSLGRMTPDAIAERLKAVAEKVTR